MKLRYIGGADQKVLSEDDMRQLGVEDHPGLWWSENQPVLEVEDELGELLLGQVRDLRVEADEAETLVEDHTKEELIEQAKGLGISGTSKMTKDELASAIAAAQEEEAARASDAGDAIEPTA